MASPVPLLFLSDSISAPTGLARITRDVAVRTHKHLSDVFRVGTAGMGGSGSREFSFPQYNLTTSDWICLNLPEIWEDFAGDEPGIICSVWDPSRLGWLARPEINEEISKYQELKRFLTNPSFKRWIYAPVDASGPNDKLTFPLAQNLLGFDRILAYGEFGEDVIRRTLGEQESEKRGLTSLPHGVDTDIFYSKDHETARESFFSITGAASIFRESEPIEPDEILIGAVATNQFRKDMPLLIETVSILARNRKIRFWLHTDVLERTGGWSIPALLVDFGIMDRTVISLDHIPDSDMARAYSACDLTIAPGPEGFGLPIAESLACGTPVIHGAYAGGADILPEEMQVGPVAFRYEGIWACKRPVYRAEDWAAKAEEWIGKSADLYSRYDWNRNWLKWEKWLKEGVK